MAFLFCWHSWCVHCFALLFSNASSSRDVTICLTVNLVQTEMSLQLLDKLPWTFVPVSICSNEFGDSLSFPLAPPWHWQLNWTFCYSFFPELPAVQAGEIFTCSVKSLRIFDMDWQHFFHAFMHVISLNSYNTFVGMDSYLQSWWHDRPSWQTCVYS